MTLRLRRGSSANFGSVTLQAGEPAFVLDTGKLYIGDGTNKILINIDPSASGSNTYVVNSEAAMLALTAIVGDLAVRTDVSKTFSLRVTGPSTLANWQDLLAPSGAVTSVAGRIGAVTLSSTDVGLGNVTNESKATMLASAALTGTPTAPTAATATDTTQIATTAFVKAQGYLTSSSDIDGGTF